MVRIEEGDQQRGDVGAVHVGVGHDDDAVVAQVLFLEASSLPATPRASIEVGELLVGAVLSRVAQADVQDLAAQGQDRLGGCGCGPVWREPPAVSPSTMKISVPSRRRCRAVGQLAGQAQLARSPRPGRPPCPCGASAAPRRGSMTNWSRALAALGWAVSQWSKGSRRRALDQAAGRRRRTAAPWSGPGIPGCG